MSMAYNVTNSKDSAVRGDVRDSLKKAIIDRRLAAGETDLLSVLWEDKQPESPTEMTEEEKARADQRRQNNRMAARKCRRKQQVTRKTVEKEYALERQKRKQLLSELGELKRERHQLLMVWQSVSQAHNDPPAGPHDTATIHTLPTAPRPLPACKSLQVVPNGTDNSTNVQVVHRTENSLDINKDGSANMHSSNDSTSMDMKPENYTQLPLQGNNGNIFILNTVPVNGKICGNPVIDPAVKYPSLSPVTTGIVYSSLCALNSQLEGYSEMSDGPNKVGQDNTGDKVTVVSSTPLPDYSTDANSDTSCEEERAGQPYNSGTSGDDSDIEVLDIDEEKPLVIDLTK